MNRPARGYKAAICGWCATPFRTRNKARCCSSSCAARYRSIGSSTPIPWVRCQYCTDWMVGRGHARYCNAHRGMDKRRLNMTHISYGQCARCSSTYIRRTVHLGEFCSTNCANRTRNRNRRHLERSAQRTGDNITLRQLGERDSWRCHLCGKPVTKTPGNLPKSPSIDHLVPLSERGTHTWPNVALAHRACNTTRGTGQAQLRLIA